MKYFPLINILTCILIVVIMMMIKTKQINNDIKNMKDDGTCFGIDDLEDFDNDISKGHFDDRLKNC